jgi:AAHS family benzoate transporter-like MFS transporter
MRGSRTVVVICLLVTVLDGLDLLMFGAVLPTLLESGQWGITPVSAGLIGSLSLFGMMSGAMAAGYLGDLWGRRPLVLACVASFTVFTALCGLAPNLELFGVFRFLGGIGFGGALPTVIALTMEYVRMEHRQLFNGIVQTGFPIGGAVIAGLAIVVVPAFGWQWLFLGGGLIGLVLLLAAWRRLPESLAFLIARGRQEEAAELASRYGVPEGAEAAQAVRTTERAPSDAALKVLFRPDLRVATLLFPLINLCGLLVGYAMQTWMPQLLRSKGYDLGSALIFLVLFNLGIATGMVVLSGLADRLGSRRVIAAGFLVGAAAVALLALGPAQALVVLLVLVIGFCVASQTAVSGFVGVHYPAAARGTALGLTLGLGRIGGVAGPLLVGVLVTSSIGSTGTMIVFAGVGVVAAALVAAVPRSRAAAGGEVSDRPSGPRRTGSTPEPSSPRRPTR